MAEPAIDPKFYRSAAEAAAPDEQLAYVAAFDRAAGKPAAMTVIDVDPASDTYVQRRAAHPAEPDMPLAGAPQMVEVSRDGRRDSYCHSG